MSFGYYFNLVRRDSNLNFSSWFHLFGSLNYCHLENLLKYSHFLTHLFSYHNEVYIFIFIPLHKFDCSLVSHRKLMFSFLLNGPSASQILFSLPSSFCIFGTKVNKYTYIKVVKNLTLSLFLSRLSFRSMRGVRSGQVASTRHTVTSGSKTLKASPKKGNECFCVYVFVVGGNIFISAERKSISCLNCAPGSCGQESSR